MSALRPFRFACRAVSGQATTSTQWTALAQRAEDLGYATFAAADHTTTSYAPLLALQQVAAVTSRIRLATLVLNIDFRHPVMLAKEAATLDQLSGGRLELGIGAGWDVRDYDQSGIVLEPAGVRIDRLAETIAILQGYWTSERMTFAGNFYSVQDLPCTPRPVQKRLPLLVGGAGPRLLRLAAEQADIVSFDSCRDAREERTVAGLRAKTERVRRLAGRDVELHLNPDLWAITEDREAALEATAMLFGVPLEDLEHSAYVLAGSLESIEEHLLNLRDQTGISHVTIPADQLDSFAPLVERLTTV